MEKTNPGTPSILTPVQLNIRIDPAMKEAFALECKKRGVSQADVLNTLLEVWLNHAGNAQIMHLDGTPCPIAAMIESLSNAVRQTISR